MTAIEYFFSPVRPAQKHGLRSRLALMMAIAQQRKALAELDDARLDDLGISRTEAKREASRMMWDLPRSWTHKRQ